MKTKYSYTIYLDNKNNLQHHKKTKIKEKTYENALKICKIKKKDYTLYMWELILSSDPRFWFLSDIGNPFIKVSVQLIIWGFLVLIFYWFAIWSSWLIAKQLIKKEYISIAAQNLIKNIVFIILFCLLFTIAFRAVWFNFIAVTSWLIFAIWYASRGFIRECISWIMLVTTKEIRMGDLIEINDRTSIWPLFGKVEDITLRYTVLRANRDLRRYIIPNHILTTSTIKTYTIEDLIKYELSFELQRTINHQEIETIILNTLQNLQRIEHTYTKVIFDRITEQWQSYTLYCYANPKCWVPRPMIYSNIYSILFKSFQAHDISIIPYPHISLTFDNHDNNISRILERFWSLKHRYIN